MTDPARTSALRLPAVFLDRDGTLTEPRHYPSRPEDLVLQAGIGPPLLALQHAGFALVVVTNQSGLARGLVDEAAIAPMHQRLRELLAHHQVQLDGIYLCPHHPGGTVPRFSIACSCRKPAPGMLHQAAGDLGRDLSSSWMVGDSVCDIDAGHRAGTRTALVGPQPRADVAPTLYRTTTAQALTAIAACEIPLYESDELGSNDLGAKWAAVRESVLGEAHQNDRPGLARPVHAVDAHPGPDDRRTWPEDRRADGG